MKKKIYRKYWNLVFKKIFNWARMNGVPIETTCSKISKYRKYIQKLKSVHQIRENDYRNGHETYGYDSIEDIKANLIYISDRFHAGFRLAWLVNVPQEVQRLKDSNKHE